MTFADWKAQLVPTVGRDSDGEPLYYRLFDPSSQQNISLPVTSGPRLVDAKGWLPRMLYRLVQGVGVQ